MKLKILLFILVLVPNAFSQPAKSVVSNLEAISESVKLAPCKSEDRRDAVKQLFIQMGAKEEDVIIEKFKKDKIQNVVVKLKGKSDETVIIGGHYDKTIDGCGAIDNWTGISIIAHIYKTLSQLALNKSYVFVAFDQEEPGLFGSAAMANAIPKEERQKYCAMINLDSFGFATPFSLQQASSSKLVKLAQTLAKENDMKLLDVRIEGADSDSTSFKNIKIPSITFCGFDGKWESYLHSKNDQVEKINMQSVYLGYRFTLAFIGKIDAMACGDLIK